MTPTTWYVQMLVWHLRHNICKDICIRYFANANIITTNICKWYLQMLSVCRWYLCEYLHTDTEVLSHGEIICTRRYYLSICRYYLQIYLLISLADSKSWHAYRHTWSSHSFDHMRWYIFTLISLHMMTWVWRFTSSHSYDILHLDTHIITLIAFHDTEISSHGEIICTRRYYLSICRYYLQMYLLISLADSKSWPAYPHTKISCTHGDITFWGGYD